MFLLQEDNALKNKLKGLVVSTTNGTQPVQVFFGAPDENNNTRSYPFIQIDLVNLIHDTEREHRGIVRLNYIPDNGSGGSNYAWVNDTTPTIRYPIPYLLQYQVTTWARSARQNRQIDSLILSTAIKPRYGNVAVIEDGTVRRLDLVSTMSAHTMEGQKRLFRTIYTLNISSELALDVVQTITNVRQVSLVTGVGNSALPGDFMTITGTVRGQSGYAVFTATSSLTATASNITTAANATASGGSTLTARAS